VNAVELASQIYRLAKERGIVGPKDYFSILNRVRKLERAGVDLHLFDVERLDFHSRDTLLASIDAEVRRLLPREVVEPIEELENYIAYLVYEAPKEYAPDAWEALGQLAELSPSAARRWYPAVRQKFGEPAKLPPALRRALRQAPRRARRVAERAKKAVEVVEERPEEKKRAVEELTKFIKETEEWTLAHDIVYDMLSRAVVEETRRARGVVLYTEWPKVAVEGVSPDAFSVYKDVVVEVRGRGVYIFPAERLLEDIDRAIYFARGRGYREEEIRARIVDAWRDVLTAPRDRRMSLLMSLFPEKKAPPPVERREERRREKGEEGGLRIGGWAYRPFPERAEEVWDILSSLHGPAYADLVYKTIEWNEWKCASTRPPADIYDLCVRKILRVAGFEPTEDAVKDFCGWLAKNREVSETLRKKGLYPKWC